MTSPSYELQVAIVTRLKATAAVTTLVGTRVYDHVPGSHAFPYISLGPSQVLWDDIDCRDGFEITFQIDVWSRAVGYPEIKRIAEAVRVALHQSDLPLTDNAMVALDHRQTREFRDPDGLTSHAALEFVALVEQP